MTDDALRARLDRQRWLYTVAGLFGLAMVAFSLNEVQHAQEKQALAYACGVLHGYGAEEDSTCQGYRRIAVRWDVWAVSDDNEMILLKIDEGRHVQR